MKWLFWKKKKSNEGIKVGNRRYKLKLYASKMELPNPCMNDGWQVDVKENQGSVQYGHSYQSAGQLVWIVPNGDRRYPEETTKEYKVNSRLEVAGKSYLNIHSICVKADKYQERCKDIYGREVVYIRERFPCFDSYDYLHEDRFYHWFFLKENHKLTRVYYEDETDIIYVTEDVEYLEDTCLRRLKELQFI